MLAEEIWQLANVYTAFFLSTAALFSVEFYALRGSYGYGYTPRVGGATNSTKLFAVNSAGISSLLFSVFFTESRCITS